MTSCPPVPWRPLRAGEAPYAADVAASMGELLNAAVPELRADLALLQHCDASDDLRALASQIAAVAGELERLAAAFAQAAGPAPAEV